MSNGALPKTKASKSSLKSSEWREDAKVQNSNSEFSFELKPKPKLTCIPENCSKFFSDLRWVDYWRLSSSFWLIIVVNHFAEKHNHWMCPRRRRCQKNHGQFCSSVQKVICTPKISLCKWRAWEWKCHTWKTKFWPTHLFWKRSLCEDMDTLEPKENIFSFKNDRLWYEAKLIKSDLADLRQMFGFFLNENNKIIWFRVEI